MAIQLNQISRPLPVDVVFSPLSYHLDLVSQASSPLIQMRYNIDGSYLPDRNVAALVLSPVLSVSDPDGVLTTSAAMSNMTTTWQVLDQSGQAYVQTLPTSAVADGFYLRSVPGKNYKELVVTKNLPANASVRVRCTVEFTDVRKNERIRVSAETQLSCLATSDPCYTLDALVPDLQHYNPFSSSSSEAPTSSHVVFSVQAKEGLRQLSDGEVTYFWYRLSSDGTELLFSSADACYVAGQGTGSLTVDMAYCSEITVVARLASSAGASHPDLGLRRQFTARWKYPSPLEVDVTSHHGGGVKTGDPAHFFTVLVHAGGQLLVEDVVRRHFRFRWWRCPQGSDGAAKVDLGYGYGIYVVASSLMEAGSRNMLVGTDAFLVGALLPVTHDDEGTPKEVTLTVDGTEYLVVG